MDYSGLQGVLEYLISVLSIPFQILSSLHTLHPINRFFSTDSENDLSLFNPTEEHKMLREMVFIKLY